MNRSATSRRANRVSASAFGAGTSGEASIASGASRALAELADDLAVHDERGRLAGAGPHVSRDRRPRCQNGSSTSSPSTRRSGNGCAADRVPGALPVLGQRARCTPRRTPSRRAPDARAGSRTRASGPSRSPAARGSRCPRRPRSGVARTSRARRRCARRAPPRADPCRTSRSGAAIAGTARSRGAPSPPRRTARRSSVGRHRRTREASVLGTDGEVRAAHPHLGLEARRVDLEHVEAVGVDDEVDRRGAGLVGQPLQQEVLDPDAGVVELGLVSRDDEQLGRVGRRRPAGRPCARRTSGRAPTASRRASAPQLAHRHAAHLEVPACGARSRSPRASPAHSPYSGCVSSSPCPAGVVDFGPRPSRAGP